MPLMNDHAEVKKFGLKIFQQPAGDDLHSLPGENELVKTHINN
jgi:hypothetical protein